MKSSIFILLVFWPKLWVSFQVSKMWVEELYLETYLSLQGNFMSIM